MRAPVSARALVQRINRQIRPRRLRGTRGRGPTLYRLIDGDIVVDLNVDLEKLGRSCGVLEQWEELQQSEK